MSALDQALEIPIVKLEHPRLCKEAAAELAALRAEVDELKNTVIELVDGKSTWEIEDDGFPEERAKEIISLYRRLMAERKSAA
jgi:DNA-binding FrmR family transcriptional regulator